MFRKSTTVWLLLLMLWIPFTPVIAATPNSVSQFLDEYYTAVKEGNLTLSHNLLHYNEGKLESYIEKYQPLQVERFHEMRDKALGRQNVLENVTNGHLELALWLDALAHKDPLYFSNEKAELVNMIEQYHNRIEPEAPVALSNIKESWASVLPAAALTFDGSVYQQFQHHYKLLSQAKDPEEIDRILSLSLELMEASSDEEGIRLDALLWTIIIIGGCIIFTLTYVAVLKYQAEKKEKSQKSSSRDLNS